MFVRLNFEEAHTHTHTQNKTNTKTHTQKKQQQKNNNIETLKCQVKNYMYIQILNQVDE